MHTVNVMFVYCPCILFYCACFNCAWLRLQVDGVAVCYVPSDMVNPEKIRVSFQAAVVCEFNLIGRIRALTNDQSSIGMIID